MTTPKTGAERKESLRGEQSSTRPMTAVEVTVDSLISAKQRGTPAMGFSEAAREVFKDNPKLYEVYRQEATTRPR